MTWKCCDCGQLVRTGLGWCPTCEPTKVKPIPDIDDPINHPRHYTKHPSGIECIQVTEHMGFCLGNAIKYIWRAGLKKDANTTDDIRKAIWYLERELKRIEGEGGTPPSNSF